MKTTPLEIQQKQFRVKFRGFDIREVDSFLEEMADLFASMKQENEALKEEIRRLRHEMQGYVEREETFKRAMLNSQKAVDQIKENARKSAELIISDAEVNAEKMLNKAHSRLAQLHDDISELKRQRLQIEVQIRSILDAHSKMLELSKEGIETMDQEDDKIKLLRRSK